MLDKEKGGSWVPKDKIKKFWYLVVGMTILVALFVFWLSLRAYLAVDNPFYVVPSESMVPTLNVGDVVLIRNGAGYLFDDLEVGDIIVFHTNDGGGRIIVHRIVEIYSDGQTGERLIKTKGDNNPQSYENFDYPIKRQNYYGKVISVIPKIGVLSTTLKPQAK
jgi:signal peptidase